MRRRVGPVQQWVDSIPAKPDIASECREYNPADEPLMPSEPKDIPFPRELKPPSMTVSAPINVSNSPAMSTPVLPSSLPHHRLARDASFQSDSSHCSSVESLLELRKADPTAILLDLGFGGCTASPRENGPLCRIPSRFLQPSSLKGIVIDDFIKQQQETSESFDSVSLGYRGLTGSPYVAPSEIVQKIMERLRERDNHEADTSLYGGYCEQYSPSYQNGRLSVLSPDNRQFLEQPRSKSPDMRNKRMIIGQKSFTFGCDGNLIEVPSGSTKLVSVDTVDSPNTAALGNGKSIESERSSVESITFEYRCYFSSNDEKLTKQSSFEDNRTVPSDSNIARDNNTSLDVADNDERRYDSSDAIAACARHELQRCLDIRRASDGFCNIRSPENVSFVEGRRFSDSALREGGRDECTLLQKRKSLRRQSRVCDITAMHHCDPTKSGLPDAILESNVADEAETPSDAISTSTHQLNAPKSLQSTESQGSLELKIDTESEKSNHTPLNIVESIGCDRIERFQEAPEKDHSCMRDNHFCRHRGKYKSCKCSANCSNCCCHVDKRKYLKKMKKIMQENKKLEDRLAKSRREVAQIRDMLSNIRSVRMEPGF